MISNNNYDDKLTMRNSLFPENFSPSPEVCTFIHHQAFLLMDRAFYSLYGGGTESPEYAKALWDVAQAYQQIIYEQHIPF